MGAFLAFLKPFLKDKGIAVIRDKSVWVVIVAVLIQIANKYMKLGFDETTVNVVATGIGGWFVVHFATKFKKPEVKE